jgi:hypothetical protein
MTITGWITMTIVIGSMTSLLVWCSWKIMSTPNVTESVLSPLEFKSSIIVLPPHSVESASSADLDMLGTPEIPETNKPS